MVKNIYAIFSSRFNSSVFSRSRSFVVPKTVVTIRLLNLFYAQGYIYSYQILNNYSYIVFPNHKAIPFKLQYFSASKFSFFKLKRLSNSGYFYIVNTAFGPQFSDSALVSRTSGKPIFKLVYFS
jgi:ribosomal protein S8